VGLFCTFAAVERVTLSGDAVAVLETVKLMHFPLHLGDLPRSTRRDEWPNETASDRQEQTSKQKFRSTSNTACSRSRQEFALF
jgi:hypothetical protein